MSSPTAFDLYNSLVAVIDRAYESKSIYDVPKAAEAAGMVGGEEPRGGFSQRWNYEFTDAAGQTVKIHCRWWDQSKSFSIQPDMHVMSVELVGSSPIMAHERRYEQ